MPKRSHDLMAVCAESKAAGMMEKGDRRGTKEVINVRYDAEGI